MGNWIAKTWQPGLLSAIQAFVIAVIAAVVMTEDQPLTVFSSFSELSAKLTESPTLAFLITATPLLMMFFWFARTVWLTIEYVGVGTIIVIVLVVTALIYLKNNKPEVLERSGLAGWLEPEAPNSLRSSTDTDNRATLSSAQPRCQQIECIRVGDRQTKPYLPPTPVVPPVAR